jgi:hypothetical protein
MYIFDVAAQQGRWLAVKQATIAANVSNANTPGYKAQEVRPFDEVLERTKLTLAATQAGHLDAAGTEMTFEGPERLGAYLRATEWRTASAADRKLFQAPFRAAFGLTHTSCFPSRKHSTSLGSIC